MIQLIVYTGFYWAVKVMENRPVVAALRLRLESALWVGFRAGKELRLLMLAIPGHAEVPALWESTRFCRGWLTTWGMPLVITLSGGEGVKAVRTQCNCAVLSCIVGELARRQELGGRDLCGSEMYRGQPPSCVYKKVASCWNSFSPCHKYRP